MAPRRHRIMNYCALICLTRKHPRCAFQVVPISGSSHLHSSHNRVCTQSYPPFLPLAPENLTPHHYLSPSSAIQVAPRTTNHQNGVSSERRIRDHCPLYGQGFHACFYTGMMHLLADSPIRLPSSIAHAQPTAQQRSCCATFARLNLNNRYSGVDKGDSGWRITS